jgi:hypothetical protein
MVRRTRHFKARRKSLRSLSGCHREICPGIVSASWESVGIACPFCGAAMYEKAA